jgi:dephospho-CoA kinase
VFADPQARRRLEAAIHPLVAARFEQLALRHGGVVVFEATLLVETGGARRFDRLVTVEADAERRIERAIARGIRRSACTIPNPCRPRPPSSTRPRSSWCAATASPA